MSVLEIPAAPSRAARPRASRSRAADDAALFAALRAGEPRAREALVERFMPLARQIARRYHYGEEPLDDLLQVASIGLLKAIDRFDPDRGLAFTSFAVPTISGEVRRHFRDKTWSVRVPRGLQELTLALNRAIARLTTDLGRSPTVPELAEALECGDEQVLEALEARSAHRATSLQAPARDGGDDTDATLGDSLGTDDDGFARAEDRATLDSLLGAVSARDREVLGMRFQQDMTQQQIAEIIGVSQMQVSRIIRQAVARMHTVASAQRGG